MWAKRLNEGIAFVKNHEEFKKLSLETSSTKSEVGLLMTSRALEQRRGGDIKERLNEIKGEEKSYTILSSHTCPF